MNKGKLNEIKVQIERIQSIMIAHVTNGREASQPKEYKELYINLLLNLEQMGYSNPNPFRTIEEVWGHCRLKLPTYSERRIYVNAMYSDIILDIERHLRKEKDPAHWEKANEELTDELEPIRRQWLKAKNFIYANPPDFENSIKESINSIESAAKILCKEPRLTLGQIIKQAEIDEDIKKVISQMYGLVSNKDFVRHGGTQEQMIDAKDAEFFLEFASISIVYLKAKLKDKKSANIT